MKRYGKDLIFISRIMRDGNGVEQIEEERIKHEDKEIFDLQCLSITQGTYIASNMNCYVVKLKQVIPDSALSIINEFSSVTDFPKEAALIALNREIKMLRHIKKICSEQGFIQDLINSNELLKALIQTKPK